MKKLILLIAIICCSTLASIAQKKNDCPVLDGRTDTIICNDKKMLLDLSFCESNGQYHDGVLTDIDGKEEFCFFYKYDNKNNLTKITFWTFQWNNGGYVTKDKIGVLKIRGNKQQLIVKRGFTLSLDFVKHITKT